MDARFLSMLCDPLTRDSLRYVTERTSDGNVEEMLVNPATGRRYPIRDGIPVFLDEADVAGLDKKYQSLYNRYAPLYDPFISFFSFLAKLKGGEDWRKSFLSRLEVGGDDRVLEVSIGTGLNLPYLPRTCQFFGLDISWGMLKRCQKNVRRWGNSCELYLGNAEYLPFTGESFDVVFHVGGINFFSDKARAINEMIRVAKPGTRLLIVDETAKVVRQFENIPIINKFYNKEMEKQTEPPVDLLPGDMLEKEVDYLADGMIYCLQFRKPGKGKATR